MNKRPTCLNPLIPARIRWGRKGKIMHKRGFVIAAIGLAIVMSLPAIGTTMTMSKESLSAHTLRHGEGALGVSPLPPLKDLTDFYGGATLPLRVLVTDADETGIIDAEVTVWVNGEPATSTNHPEMGNTMTRLNGNLYQFNLDTRPYPAGPGTEPIVLLIVAMTPDDRSFEFSTEITLN